MEVISLILGLIILIVFFYISINVGNIRKNVQSIQQILSKETGFGLVTKCKSCGKKITGKPDTCPHCGEKKDWTTLV